MSEKHLAAIDERIDKLTTIVEEIVSKEGELKQAQLTFMHNVDHELGWIQSWTKQTFYMFGIFFCVLTWTIWRN